MSVEGSSCVPEVIAIGTGSKCIGQSKMCDQGIMSTVAIYSHCSVRVLYYIYTRCMCDDLSLETIVIACAHIQIVVLSL